MSETAVRRVFLLGCPRSGTTLLQTMLAAHPQVVSFPESHFFRSLLRRQRVLRFAGLASPEAGARLAGFVEELRRPDLQALLPGTAIRAEPHVRAFLAVLDRLATEKGASVWVEKTPGHLRHLRWIEHYVPGARFVHVVRNGRDVVASLYDVSQTNPRVWGGFRSLELCAERWIEDVEISCRCVGRPLHTIVRYERLVSEPEAELRAICAFLGLEFDEAMLERRADAAQALLLPGETWKEGARGPVQPPERKFARLLDAAQREYIERRLGCVDLDSWAGPAAAPGAAPAGG